MRHEPDVQPSSDLQRLCRLTDTLQPLGRSVKHRGIAISSYPSMGSLILCPTPVPVNCIVASDKRPGRCGGPIGLSGVLSRSSRRESYRRGVGKQDAWALSRSDKSRAPDRLGVYPASSHAKPPAVLRAAGEDVG